MVNKQEAIEKLESRAFDIEDTDLVVGLSFAKHTINQIDEPKKPVVPQFIDTWIQGASYNGFDLYESMTDDEMPDKVATWIVCNSETFAKAWFYGYEVEKEKLYLARFKLLDDVVGECYINQTIDDKKLFLGNLDENDYVKVFFTREELKDLGLWENVLIDTDEVKDD